MSRVVTSAGRRRLSVFGGVLWGCLAMGAMGCAKDEMSGGMPDLTGDSPDLTTDDGGVVPPDLASPNKFRLDPGKYTTTDVFSITDGCNVPPLTNANVQFERTLGYNANTKLYSLTSELGSPMGEGMVVNDQGTLSLTASVSNGMGCVWTSTRTSELTLTKDNVFRLVFTDKRTNFAPIGAMGMCPRTTPCTLTWTVQMAL